MLPLFFVWHEDNEYINKPETNNSVMIYRKRACTTKFVEGRHNDDNTTTYMLVFKIEKVLLVRFPVFQRPAIFKESFVKLI